MPTNGGRRGAAVLAWSLAIAGITVVALGLVLWAGRGFGALPVSFGRSWVGVIGLVISPLAYITFGALLSARLSRNSVGWLLLGCGMLLASMLPVNLLVAVAHESLRPPDPLLVVVAWLRNAFATPGTAALLITAVYLFPDGRPVSRRWWSGIAVGLAGGALLALGAALNREGMVTYPTLSNPTAAPAELVPVVNAIQVTGVTLTVVAGIHAVVSLARRYRTGDSVQRAQLRWILLATMITMLTAMPFLLTRYLVDVGNTLGELAALGVQLAMSTFPIAAAVAISRYRLYDVDLLIGRTVVYVPLMAILGGLYTAGIAVFQRLFVMLTGETSDAAVILTVLLLASLFTPLRRGLEGALERRFPRSSVAVGSASSPPHAVESPVPPPAAPGLRSPVPVAQLYEMDQRGSVVCPIKGHRVGLATCLACPELRAITKAPRAAVVCTGQPPNVTAESPA